MLSIKKVGLIANFVDKGRRGMQSQGYSESGAIDSVHYALANALLGMPLNSPAIEVLGGQFVCTFSKGCLVCVTGAQASLKINETALKNNTVINVQPGDQLTIADLSDGLSNYIGLAAQFDLPLFANSVCAITREGSGGLRGDGSALRAGDEISYAEKVPKKTGSKKSNRAFMQSDLEHEFSKSLNAFQLSVAKKHKKIRLNLAYQAAFFSEQQLAQFFHHHYTISPQSDRMGMRLKGDSILCQKQVLSSQAIVLGAVQIPGDGQPIIMRQDRQTIGGYPIIGVVDFLSIAILGQAKPGQTLQFIISDFEYSRQQTLLVWSELTKLAEKRAHAFFV